jgi:hypothetical protein
MECFKMENIERWLILEMQNEKPAGSFSGIGEVVLGYVIVQAVTGRRHEGAKCAEPFYLLRLRPIVKIVRSSVFPKQITTKTLASRGGL